MDGRHSCPKLQILSPCQSPAQAKIKWVLFGYVGVVNLHVWYGAVYGTCNVFPCSGGGLWVDCVCGWGSNMGAL